MESELSGIFQVKIVTKNIVRGSPATQFMHMRVNACEAFTQNKEKIQKFKETVKFKAYFSNITR